MLSALDVDGSGRTQWTGPLEPPGHRAPNVTGGFAGALPLVTGQCPGTRAMNARVSRSLGRPDLDEGTLVDAMPSAAWEPARQSRTSERMSAGAPPGDTKRQESGMQNA